MPSTVLPAQIQEAAGGRAMHENPRTVAGRHLGGTFRARTATAALWMACLDGSRPSCPECQCRWARQPRAPGCSPSWIDRTLTLEVSGISSSHDMVGSHMFGPVSRERLLLPSRQTQQDWEQLCVLRQVNELREWDGHQEETGVEEGASHELRLNNQVVGVFPNRGSRQQAGHTGNVLGKLTRKRDH